MMQNEITSPAFAGEICHFAGGAAEIKPENEQICHDSGNLAAKNFLNFDLTISK